LSEQQQINKNIVRKVRIKYYLCNIDTLKMYNVEHGSCFSIWIDFDLQIRQDFQQMILVS